MEYCDYIFAICQQPKEWLNLWVAFVAALISAISLMISIRFASQTFRPIISVAVKTHSGGNVSIVYNLEVLNSGSIPAKDIYFKADQSDIENALASEKYKDKTNFWLACFDEKCEIPVLQNGTKVSCSFGHTQGNEAGFWRYGATIPVVVKYKGWFGKNYVEKQYIYIRDSDSFTGYTWSPQT